MKFNDVEVFIRLMEANLIDENSKPVLYSIFKNYATIHRYNGNKQKVVFIGHPTENLFAFYVKYDSDPNALREAYDWFVLIATGDYTPLKEKHVLMGDFAIPKEWAPRKDR